MVFCQVLAYVCKVTKDQLISRYEIIEKSYEIRLYAKEKSSTSLITKDKAEGGQR